MAMNIPIGTDIILPDDPDGSRQQTEIAQTDFQSGKTDVAGYRQQISEIAKQHPTCLTAWACLGELVLPTT